MKTFRSRPFWLLLALVFLFTRCAGDSPTAPNSGVVSVSLNPPAATLRVGATVQITASVTIDGVAATQTVTFTSSNAAVVSATPGGLLRALTIGSATITATTAGGISASGVVTVVPGLPSQVVKTAGDNQTTAAGASVPTPPSVTVRDSAGNVTPDVPVVFAAGANSGSVTGGTTTTNSAGVATVGSWTVSTNAGTNTLTATVAGLPAVTFTATGTAPVGPSTIVTQAGDAQTALVNTAVAIAPSVLVRNGTGTPIAGVSVTFAPGAGGGSVTGATQVTNASGIATVGSWVLGPAAGANTLTATAAGIGSVNFGATATAPAPTGTLNLSSNSMIFGTVLGGGLAGTNTLNVTAGGATQVANLTVGTITYGPGGSGWLTASLNGTTTPAVLSVSANGTGLAIGSYTATIPVTSTSATNSPQNVSVTFNVLPPQSLAFITQPAGTVTAAVLTTQPVLKIVDASGATITSANGTVTANIASGVGTLSGTTTVNAVNGVATFTNLKITGAGAFTLGFSSSQAQSTTSASFNIAALPATQMAVSTQPAGASSNAVFTTAPVVQLRDVNGNAAIGNTAAVTVALDASSTGTGTLSGTTTVNAANGVATFNNLKISTPGTYVLLFTTSGLTSVTSSSLTVTLSPPVSLAMATQPTGAVSNSPLAQQPVVQVRDVSNGLVAGATNLVTATLNGTGGTLSGTTTVAAVNGVATFTDLKVVGAGTYTLTFSSGTLVTATSAAFTITPLPASQLAIGTQPGSAATGAFLSPQPVIQVKDILNGTVVGSSVAVTATLNGAGGTLSGTTTVNAVNGIATFTDLKIAGPGSYTLTFSAGALTPATSTSFGITALPATQLGIATQPVGGFTGAVLTTQPVVQVKDASNGVVAGATNAVTATLVGAGGTLTGTTTVNAVNGIATFTDLVISGAGNYTISFSAGTLTGTSSGTVTIAALPATQVAIQTPPAGGSSGVAFSTQPVIQIRDVNNGVVAGATNAVVATLNGAGGTLSGTTTVNAINGTATFTNLKITGAGTYTITFSSGALTAATTGNITVAQVPTQVAITTQAAGAVNGSVFTTQPVVEIRDVTGTIVAGATNAVTATLNGAGGTLSGTTTVAAVNGVAIFTDLKVTGAGTYTITYSATSLAAATSGNLVVAALPASQLTLGTAPGGGSTGVNLNPQPVVLVKDALNNTTAGATNAVTATLNGAGGTLSGTTTVNAVNGVATFTDLKIAGPGSYTLTFSAAGLTPVTSASFGITALPATQLAVSTQPSGATTGSTLTTQPVVQVRDASNGVVAGATNAITATLVGGGGTLSGTTTVNAVNGVATFTDLKVTGTGSYTINFSTAGLTGASSNAITITALPATKLSIGQSPSGGSSGVAFTTQPIIQVQDVNSGVVSGAANQVTATLNTVSGGPGTLGGTASVNAVNGFANFSNLKISGAGTYTITFSAAGLTPVTTGNIVVAQVATNLSLTTPPSSNASTGTVFATQPVVQVNDVTATAVAGATNAVTATLVGAGGTLSGTTTVNAVNGIATFTDLKITGAGTYTLNFTSAGLTQVASANIVVAGLPGTHLEVFTQPAGAVSGSIFGTQPVVRVLDVNNNVVPGASDAITVEFLPVTGAPAFGTPTRNAVNGVATWTDLRIDGGGTYTLRFRATGLTEAISNAFTITQTPTQLGVATQPSGAATGAALGTQPVVEVRDVAGQKVLNATNNVTATLVGGGTLSGTTTVAAVNGTATFTNLVVSGTGSYTLNFTAGALTGASSNAFTITALPATKLAIGQAPSGGSSGVAFTTQPIIQVQDGNSSVVSGASNQVTATLNTVSGGPGTLSGTTSVNAVNGFANFSNLKISGAGTYTITFSAAGLTPVTTGNLVMSQVAAALQVTAQPGGAANGAVFTNQPIVIVNDAAGAQVTTASNAITATLVGAGGTLSGTTTVNAVNGTATFTDLKVTGTGNYTINFTSGTLTPATSASFAVTAVPVSLAISTQPAGALSGAALGTQPVVQIRDGANALVAGATNSVTAVLNGAGGTLSGTTTVAAVNGVATFTNLVVTGAGTYTITFSSGTLTSATSGSVTITAPPPATIGLNVGAAATLNATNGVQADIPITLDMSNAQGNNIASITFTVDWDATKFNYVQYDNTSSAIGSGSTVVVNEGNAANGHITVSAFSNNGTTTNRTILTLSLMPKASAAGTVVSTTASAAGDSTGTVNQLSKIVYRPLSVTTP